MGCAASSAKVSANTVPETRDVGIASPECYSLIYSNPKGSAGAGMFPTWFMLLPGVSSGAAVGRNLPAVAEQNSGNLQTYAGWKTIAPDSLEVMFAGSYEGIRIRVGREGRNLRGRATWMTDVIGLPESSMQVFGTRSQCPTVSPGAQTEAPIRLIEHGTPPPAGTRLAIQFNNEPVVIHVADGRNMVPIMYHGRELDPNEIKSIRVLKGKEARERFGDQKVDAAILIELK